MEYPKWKIPGPLSHVLPPLLYELSVSHLWVFCHIQLNLILTYMLPQSSLEIFSQILYVCPFPWHPTSGNLFSGDNYTNLKWPIEWRFIRMLFIISKNWWWYGVGVVQTRSLNTHTHNQSIDVYRVWEMFEECLRIFFTTNAIWKALKNTL